MPNIPNSAGQTQSKKRKLSTNSSVCTTPINIDSNNIHSVRQTIPNGSGDQSKNEHSDGILNSEVYKIYCRHSNPKEAMKEIKKLKTCFQFEEPRWVLPNEADLKRGYEQTLEKIWSHGPSKWLQVKKFLDNELDDYDIMNVEVPFTEASISSAQLDDLKESDVQHNIWYIMQRAYTRIKMLLPHGYEYFFVENFESGSGVSKWYREVTLDPAWDPYPMEGLKLLKLNMFGLTNSMINQYHYEDYIKKNSVKTTWFDYAYKFLQYEKSKFFESVESNSDETGRRFGTLHIICVT